MQKTGLLFILLCLTCSLSTANAQNPIAYAGPDQDFCDGDTVQLQGSASGAGPNYTYQWSPATFISDPNIPNPQVWPPVNTAYTLVVTSNSLSSLPDTVEIRNHPIPTVNAGADSDICLGDTLQMYATASGDPGGVYQFYWSPTTSLSSGVGPDPMAYPLQDITYYVTAQSLWGCLSPEDSVRIFIRPTPIPEAGSDNVVCLGDSFLLLGGFFWATNDTLPLSQITYQWSPGYVLATPNLQQTVGLADSSRWYYLQVTAGVCSRVDSVRITGFPRPNPVVTQQGLSLTATGGLGGGTYQWYLNNSPIPGANNNIYNIIQTGCYHVVVSEGSCVAVSDTICIQSLGLEETAGRDRMEVFPNPFQDEFTITMDLPRAELIRTVLTDVQGRVVLKYPAMKWNAGPQTMVFEAAGLPDGLYYLRIQGKSSETGKTLLKFSRK